MMIVAASQPFRHILVLVMLMRVIVIVAIWALRSTIFGRYVLLTGGRGSVWTTLAGVLLLGLIFNELEFERGKGIFDLTQY